MPRNQLGRVINPTTKQLLDMRAFLPTEVSIGPGSTFACEIDDQVLSWKANTADKRVVTSTKTFSSLLHDSSWIGLLPDITKDDDNLQKFTYLPSSGGPRFLEIRDPRGKLLGFRFPITDENLEILKHSQSILSSGCAPNGHKRGTFDVKHWGVWADYSKEFRMTKEMESELETATAWLERNQELFKEASNVLRMVDPAQYAHCRNNFVEEMGKVVGPDGHPLKPVAGVWHALAINSNQVGNSSNKHVDWKDAKTSYNCIIPWGAWGGGDIVLWPLKMRIEVREGDGFLFPGAIIAHSVTAIKQGR